MKSIRSYFKLAFVTKDISDLNLLCFTEDHISRLSEQNINGQFSQTLEKTSMLYFYFLEAYKEKEKIKTAKQEYAGEVQKIMEEIKEAVRKLEGYMRFRFTKKSEIYKNVFPDGLSEYCLLNKSNIEALMSRVLVFIKNNPEQVDTHISNMIEQIYSDYQVKRKNQLKKKTDYQKNVHNKQKLRDDLAIRLQLNIYELASDFLGDMDAVDTFFSEKLLHIKRIQNTEFYKKNRLKGIEAA